MNEKSSPDDNPNSMTDAPGEHETLHAVIKKAQGIIVIVTSGSVALAATIIGYDGLPLLAFLLLKTSVASAVVGLYGLLLVLSIEAVTDKYDASPKMLSKGPQNFIRALCTGIIAMALCAGVTIVGAILVSIETRIDQMPTKADSPIAFYFEAHRLNLDQ